MYDKKRVKLPTNITLDYILSKVTEYDIYAQYIGSFKVGMIYNSPFRKDKNPSFIYWYYRLQWNPKGYSRQTKDYQQNKTR